MDTELAYLAGFFDGEGCISIIHNSKTDALTLTVSISQVNPHPLFLVQRLLGGSLHRERDNRGFRTRVSWQTSSRMALAALEKMRPFLIVKADEADIAMAYQRRVMTWNGEDKETEYAARMAMSRGVAAIKQRAYEDVELPKTERRSYDHSGPRLRMKVKPPRAKHIRVKVAAPVHSTGYDRRKRPVDAADIGILRGIYEDHGLSEAAREYGVSRQTILNWLARYGIEKTGRTPESEARRKAAAAASWRPECTSQ